jgi:hypothetical protein
MTATYDDNDLRFMYPENWSLGASDLIAGYDCRQVTLESPGGGLWMLYVFTPGTNPEQPIRSIREVIDQQYPGVEWSDVSGSFHDYPCAGHDGYFYSLDFLVCVRIRSFQTLAHTFVVVVQSENQDLDRLSSVYDAITLSLLRSSTARVGDH